MHCIIQIEDVYLHAWSLLINYVQLPHCVSMYKYQQPVS